MISEDDLVIMKVDSASRSRDVLISLLTICWHELDHN